MEVDTLKCPGYGISTSLTQLHKHLGTFDMQRNNGLQFSRDRKNYIDFQLDVLGGGGGGILKTSSGRYA